MNGDDTADVVGLFVNGARTIAQAIADPAVGRAWDELSVLEDQRVSGLAGHLARGGIWAVVDYLVQEPPPGPARFTSAGDYFATFAQLATEDDHLSIRQRGAAVADGGREALLEQIAAHLDGLEPALRPLPADHLVSVIGGQVMTLHPYLETRLVEQAVHLDDLARSVERTPWPLPAAHLRVAVDVATDIARRRGGDDGLLRALYRRGFAAEAFPVL